jgi:regulator of ribonuclease activity A
MSQYATADLFDQFGDRLQVAEPLFRDFGGARQFHGTIVTLKVFEDNSLVRQAVETPGAGSVLVVDGGGSLRCALLGDQLAELAVRNQWSGIVLFGCVRDSAVLEKLPIGIKALAAIPVKSVKRGEGQSGLPVRFAGVVFQPGASLYADEDGIVTAPDPLAR